MRKIIDDMSAHIVLFIIIAVVILWISASVFGFFERSVNLGSNKVDVYEEKSVAGDEIQASEHVIDKMQTEDSKKAFPGMHDVETDSKITAVQDHESHMDGFDNMKTDTLIASNESHSLKSGEAAKDIPYKSTKNLPEHKTSKEHWDSHLPFPSTDRKPVFQESSDRGVEFVRAAIKPLAFELNERFWGWRPNDILNFTDNVNNFQLAVLEVTRRTAVILAERISRTGSSASFDVHLERAMNWFMIKADRYWFPSPESKYRAGIRELEAYIKELENKKASFYTRADNLLPLLKAYEDLLGSCDENLVKSTEDDGTGVSYFKADDYFYYAKGVASAMATVLEAVNKEFYPILESRNGLEVLHHAIEMCHTAAQLEPWLVTDGKLDGIFANHRANIATTISHARFYLDVLITIMST